ncbi:MAG TPA: ABC transporter permease, partial [Vicinamibacterales bacterium]|nr:ABC transporter permease [Vicinamibacterales bacterium]
LGARALAAVPHALSLRFNIWSFRMLLHDLRFACRMLVTRPAFTAVATLILGLGIGANATIFSWVETTLLKPLPRVAEQDRLASLRGTTPTRQDLSFSYPNYQDLRAAKPAGLEDIIAFRSAAMNIRAGGDPIRVWGEIVTPNFFDVLRIRPALGRTFLPSDGDTPGREPVVVLGHSLWQRTFNGDPGVVGRALTLNGHPFTIVGVAPEGFTGSVVGLTLDLYVPITMQRAVLSGDRLGDRGHSFLQVLGRLAPGASMEEAQASASVVAARLAAEHPHTNKDRGTRVQPLYGDGAGSVMLPVMATLMAVVGTVLLIACANLAGLLLTRATGRQREVAVRLAVGASRAQLLRQLLIESALLALLGGAAGIVMSYWTSGTLHLFVPRTPLPIGFTATVSPAVMAFSIVVTFLTAIVFGLLPALRASRPDLVVALKDSTGTMSRGVARGRLRQGLVVAQVALSLVLLVCAALMARSVAAAQAMDPGFGAREGLLASLDLLPNGYDDERGVMFYQQLREQIASVGGVEAVSFASALPLDLSSGSDMGFRVQGYAARQDEELSTYYNRVAPDYFHAMGIEIVRGRAIGPQDIEGRELVAVINETMAARYWGGRDPLGGIVDFGNGPVRVVGIARDGKYSRLNEPPRNYMYLPLFQFYRPDVTLIVRSAESNSSGIFAVVQSQMRAIDANVPLFDVRTLGEHLRLSQFIPRMASTMLALFGGLALLLAAVGIYSVIAFSVTQRAREIGIRMALGAGRHAVVRMVMRQGLAIVLIGLAIGLGLALVAGRLLSEQLTGISPLDPVSYAGTAMGLLTIALIACLVPARRAAAMDPLQSLRRE